MKIFFFFLLFITQTFASVHFISHPDDQSIPIEFYMLRPEGEGPFPVMFLLHGYQRPDQSIGGKQMLCDRYAKPLLNEGIAVVSISLPGFGQSGGEQGFCGPFSQKAVIAVIEYCQKLSDLDSKRMGLYGASRGAIIGSMVSGRCNHLKLQILEAGSYDMKEKIALMPDYLYGIRECILRDTKNDPAALADRSALNHAEKIKTSTLFLHGKFDDRMGLSSAHAFHQKLLDAGMESKLVVYSDQGHLLSGKVWDEIIPFLRRHFFHVYGVGLNVNPPIPAIQISKIHRGTSADLSGKLRVGDAILAISPHNDEKEINALRMPIREFVSHVLGPEGSKVRLRVQHFDHSIEEVVLTRE